MNLPIFRPASAVLGFAMGGLCLAATDPAAASDHDPNAGVMTAGTHDSSASSRALDDSVLPASPDQSRMPDSSVTFFPPFPPVCGAKVTSPSFEVSFHGQLVKAPARLADYVGEYFYPALGTRLVAAPLDKNLDRRLEAYRSARAELINRLLEQIELTERRASDARENALSAFALMQAPALAKLEADAEGLRADLAGDGLQKIEWSEKRGWRLGIASLPSPAAAVAGEFQVMRAAAFYEQGLSLEQRDLLRAMAMDLLEKADPDALSHSKAVTPLFFAPESAPVRLPAGLTPALVEMIDRYNRQKNDLISELHDTVVELEKTKAASQRAAVFEELAARQRPRLAAQETLAEEIRRGLAALPETSSSTNLPSLPAGLGDHIAAYQREKLALNTELNHRLATARSLASIQTAAHSIGHTPPAELRLPWQKAGGDPNAVPSALAQANADFRRENAARYAALQHDGEAVRRELVEFAHSHPDAGTGQPLDPDALMHSFAEAAERFGRVGRDEAAGKIYRTAILQPGLSPGQRRLLCGATLAKLVPLLPSGEPLPDSRQPDPSL